MQVSAMLMFIDPPVWTDFKLHLKFKVLLRESSMK